MGLNHETINGQAPVKPKRKRSKPKAAPFDIETFDAAAAGRELEWFKAAKRTPGNDGREVVTYEWDIDDAKRSGRPNARLPVRLEMDEPYFLAMAKTVAFAGIKQKGGNMRPFGTNNNNTQPGVAIYPSRYLTFAPGKGLSFLLGRLIVEANNGEEVSYVDKDKNWTVRRGNLILTYGESAEMATRPEMAFKVAEAMVRGRRIPRDEMHSAFQRILLFWRQADREMGVVTPEPPSKKG